MKTNTKAIDHTIDTSARLAGGYGPHAAKQDAESLLRRSVLSCLLWEDNFYENGVSNYETICALIPQVDPKRVAAIAIEARTKQKLRHVPLLLAREMARLPEHKALVGELLPQIILRPDEITEFVSLYWKEGKKPLSKQVKVGLAAAFDKFNAYQFAKWLQKDKAVKLRDVLFLVHAKPGQDKEELYKQIATNTLSIPDTWEVALSTGKDKKETWTRLIQERKLGALAFVRNLRNMEKVGLPRTVIQEGFDTINARWLLPLNYLAAAKHAPAWEREIETLMLRRLGQAPKLPGHTILVVDVSGSMSASLSTKSDFTRLDAALSMAMLGAELCEHISVYATAGYDGSRIHLTERVAPRRGFALAEEIKKRAGYLRGGGIFTRQCLEYIQEQEHETPDRIAIFSDSQDCDAPERRKPNPFGKRNYIIDVSAHQHGVNYAGLWDAEISGWSENFLSYIAGIEGVELAESAN